MRFFALSILLFLHSNCLNAFAEIIYEESGKQGLKDDHGEVLIPARFEQLGWSSGETTVTDEVIGYRMNGKWGLISTDNRIISDALYQELRPAGDDIFIAKASNPALRFVPSGMIDSEGETVVPFAYLSILPAGELFIIRKFTGDGIRYGLINRKNTAILNPIFREMRYLGQNRIGIKNDSDKWALFNQKAEPLTTFSFDHIEEFSDSQTIVRRSGAFGLVDINGKMLIPPVYADIRVSDGFAEVWDFPEWDILTEENKKLHSVAFDSVLPWQQEYWKVIANGHEWIVDEDFNAVTPNTYEHIDRLDDQLLLFSENDKFGIIKPSGERIIDARYDTLFIIRGRIYAYQENGVNKGWNLFGPDGSRITPFSYQDMKPEQESGLIPIKRNMKWGMLRPDGKEVIHCTFDSVGSSLPNLIEVTFKGQSGVINEDGNWVLTPREGNISLIDKQFYLHESKGVTYLKHMERGTVYFTSNGVIVKDGYLIEKRDNDAFWKINFSGQILNSSQHHEYEEIRLESEGFIAIKMDGRYGFIDRQDRLRIANRYDNVSDFHDGLAGFKLLNQWGFLDKQERIVIQPRFDQIEHFENGLCIVKEQGLNGVIDKKGNWIIKPEYEQVDRLKNGRYKITKNGRTGLLSEDGRIIVNSKFDDLDDLDGGQVIVNRQGKYGLVSRQGDDLIPIIYEALLFDPYNKCYLGMKKVGSKTIPLR